MRSFGEHIRQLRETNSLLLRQLAARMKMDQALLSKIERGERFPTREQVLKFAKALKADEKELLLAFLSDKLLYELEDEEHALRAIKLAEEKVMYRTARPLNRTAFINKTKNYFARDGRISRAWVFGSFARGDADHKSDIDMLIEVPKNSNFSYFDLAGIQHDLENSGNRKIDIGFYGSVRPNVWERVKKDLLLVYEK